MGWCNTGGIFYNSSRRISATGRHKPRRWSVSGKMYRGERMDYEDLGVRPRVVPAATRSPRREPAKQVGSKPAQDHPWRQGYEQRMKLQRLNRSQVSPLVGVSASASP